MKPTTPSPSLKPTTPNRPLPPGFVADDTPPMRIGSQVVNPQSGMNKAALHSSTVHNPSQPFHSTSHLTGDGWVRQEMPSKSLCYSTPDIYLKPITVRTLKLITAATAEKNFTMILDALANHVSIDIRELTVPDFYFMLYWLRLNSYPRSPLTVTWTSKYGNKNVSRITMSSFDITEITMTKNELEEWRSQSLDIPRIVDMEMLSKSDITPSDKWEMENAQYIYVEGMTDYQQKIDTLNELGPDTLSIIKEFSTKIAHGVLEQVKAQDSHFNLDSALNYLNNEMAQLATIVSNLAQSDDPQAISATAGLFQHMEVRQKLLDYLTDCKTNEIQPIIEEEVVTLGTVDVSILFP